MTALADQLEQRGARLYFDIYPLLEQQWTGIPTVAAQYARRVLAQGGDRTAFFLGRRLVASGAVAEALERGGGKYLDWAIATGHALEGRVPATGGSELTLGFYPSVKRDAQLFDREFSIVHDITTITHPELHVLENIRHHAENILGAINGNAATFCVSDTVRQDVIAYFGGDTSSLYVAHNGVEWPEDFPAAFNAQGRVEPYVAVLGTMEPRKNAALVLKWLAARPAWLSACRFVFIGRMGWGDDPFAVPEALQPALAAGRIVQTGFVSEFEKYSLLCGAQATLYPSLVEGFGLPVIESLSVGTPCLSSCTSSLGEVGGTAVITFDPYSIEELDAAFTRLVSLSPARRRALSQLGRVHAQDFSWDAGFQRITEIIFEKA